MRRSVNFLISSANQTIRAGAFYGGADFDYKDRYIIGGLIRRDGSSLFGAGNRWETFGRVSAALDRVARAVVAARRGS